VSEFLIIGGNSGQGKSTFALNCAIALREFGFDVLLVDGDVKTPRIGHYVGVPFPQKTLQMVARNQCNIKSAIYEMPSGVKLLLSGLADPQSPHPSVLKAQLSKLAQIVIVDSAPHDSKWFSCGDVIFVTTDDFPSVMDVRRLSKNVKSRGVILSRSVDDKFGLSQKNVSEFLGMPVLGSVPFDAKMRECLYEGHAILEIYPDCKTSACLRSCAAKLMNLEYVPSKRLR
jgi:septum site-determining protein MinD